MSFAVRLAQEPNLRLLPSIEVEARTRFTDSELSTEMREYKTPEHELRACLSERLLWVAEAPSQGVVAFLAAEALQDGLHVLQMSVRPTAGRRGIGTSLLAHVCLEARKRRLKHVSLTTFAHIPWNAPAYAKQGFIVLEPHELTPDLRERLHHECAAGLYDRVAMRKHVA